MTVSSRSFRAIFSYIVLVLIALIFVLPFVYMIIVSLKPNSQILQDTNTLHVFLPTGDISLNNYFSVFRRIPLARFLLNSIFITATTLLFSLFINSLAGFSFAFLRWRGKHVVLSMIVAMFIVPFETIAIPLLLLVNYLPWLGVNGFEVGWLNSFHVQIIPFIADPFSIFLFVQFFKDLPHDLLEAARVEGASWLQTYAYIMVPISAPVFATVAILKFLVMWNQYLWPALVVQTDTYRPIMVGFGYLGGVQGESMAYLTVITIPVFILFLSLQQAFVNSIAATNRS